MIFIVLVMNFSAFSQASYPDTLKIKEISIVETKGIDISALPLSVTKISEVTIKESNQVNILPILEHNISGLFSTAKGIMGYGISTNSTGMINIRGVGQSNKVLTLVDGQPQWAGIFGHSIADNLVANNAKSIEIVKGPASLFYGSNAMGGSINIITRQPENNGFDGSVRAAGGSYGTQEYGVNIGYKKDRFSSFISGEYNSTDGERSNSQFYLANGFTSLKYSLSDNWKIGTTFNITNFKGHNPGMATNPILDNWMEATRGAVAVNAVNSYNKVNGTLQAYYNWGHHSINDGYFIGGNPRDYLFKSNDYVTGFSIHETLNLWKNNMTILGTDLQHWGGKAWNKNDDGTQKDIIDKNTTSAGLFVTTQQRILDKVSVNAGVRYTYSSQFHSKWIPQAGLIMNFFKGNTIVASFGEGYRAPNIRELYMYASANPDLKPEQMYNYEINITQKLFDNKLSAKIAFFYIDGKEMITVNMISGKPKNLNTGKFINKGFEADVNYRIIPSLIFNASYSFLHSDTELLAAPKHQIKTNIMYTCGGFTGSIGNETILGLYTVVGKDAKKVDYSLLYVRFSYDFKMGGNRYILSPFVNLDNITAAKYEIVDGFPMPRCTVLGGIKFNF